MAMCWVILDVRGHLKVRPNDSTAAAAMRWVLSGNGHRSTAVLVMGSCRFQWAGVHCGLDTGTWNFTNAPSRPVRMPSAYAGQRVTSLIALASVELS